MIDREFSERFPPHFLPESGPSEFGWVWCVSAPEAIHAEMQFGEQGALLGSLSLDPTPSGSRLIATTDGLWVHLSEADKAVLRGRSVLFGLWVTGGAMTDERFGQIIVSDWAAQPHEGNA